MAHLEVFLTAILVHANLLDMPLALTWNSALPNTQRKIVYLMQPVWVYQ
jgi:hypothetical protein